MIAHDPAAGGLHARPKIEYTELAPLLVVFGAACVGVLVEAFLPRPLRHLVQLAITVVARASSRAS